LLSTICDAYRRSALGWALGERRVCLSLIIWTAVLSTVTASITATREPEQPCRPAVVLDDLPGLSGGQQEGAGSHGEPSDGLVPEAGQLHTLGLGQLRERGCRNDLVQWRSVCI
jgi:hypothetical protein